MSDEMYEKAAKRADEKIAFQRHLYSYICVNIILFVINAVTSFGDWWFYWVTIFWGIGLIAHFLRVYGFGNSLEDKRDEMIEKELEKMKK